MAEILNDPLKLWLLVILAAVEIPAIIFLAVMWIKACREAKKNEHEKEDCK